MSRKSKLLLPLAVLLLGLAGTAQAECVNEPYEVEVLAAGTKTKLPDGQQVTSAAKTSAGLLEARALVKKGVIVSSGLFLDGKAGTETPFEKLPAEAQRCAKLKPVSLAPKPAQALAALLDFVLPTADAAPCRAVLVFTAEHCNYDSGGRATCGYARVYYSTCSGKYYVM